MVEPGLGGVKQSDRESDHLPRLVSRVRMRGAIFALVAFAFVT